MKDAKDQLLLQISRRFQQEYGRVWRALDDDRPDPTGLRLNSADFGDSLQVLVELQSLHVTTSKFPVWPFNASNLARFGTSFLSPVVLALATGWLWSLLGS